MKIPEIEISDDRLKEIAMAGLWFCFGGIIVMSIWLPQYREDLLQTRVTANRLSQVIERQQTLAIECEAKLRQTYAWLGLVHTGESSYPAEERR